MKNDKEERKGRKDVRKENCKKKRIRKWKTFEQNEKEEKGSTKQKKKEKTLRIKMKKDNAKKEEKNPPRKGDKIKAP